MRRLVAGVLLASAAASAAAAQAATSVAKLLSDGYEIKTAFADTSGGAYIILQRGTSAYLCHSAPRQTCEKMN
ncbi:hypothetical protein D3273_13585 [Lichenibacterium minor]|uniref:Uncharacterized protein n=1 Tax=Lichenibacterium minor TaxID=2316528 RepID=A0A4Q2U4E4_9HYPH|nr:hypothetical protein [Lichenibacterium minor]RYC31413.1 hypothetical protein D3273_13585 [Lichenibacterium minor]